MNKVRKFERVTVHSEKESLPDIMKKVQSGEIQLPDFQRNWIWDDFRIRNLIASIIRGYPIGVAMILKTDNNHNQFKYRMVEGSNNAIKDPEKLILDGQQRITSIFSSLFQDRPVRTKSDKGRKIQRYYYLDMKEVLYGDDEILDTIITVDENKEKKGKGGSVLFRLDTIKDEFKRNLFPLNKILDPNATWDWIMEYTDYYNRSQEANNLSRDFQQYITRPTQQYMLPLIELEKDTPRDAVCQIFENVNTSGVPLTVFELVTAMFAMDDFYLRDDWDNRKDQYFRSDILSTVASVDFLMGVTLLTSYLKGGAVSAKRNDMLNLDLEDYKNNADLLTTGFKEAEKLLHDEKIFRSSDLPYRAQLVPLAVICAIYFRAGKINDLQSRKNILRWYWNGVFGELYGRSTESRYASDISDMAKMLEDPGHVPKTIRDSYFTPSRLLELKTRNSSAYKGIMALILKNNARDFISGRTMDLNIFEDETIDIHHIFPQKYCKDNSLDKVKWNSVINKTPLSKKSNQQIGSKSPKEYIDKVLSPRVGEEEIPGILESHFINPESLQQNDFNSYFIDRAKTLLNKIEEVTGKEIQGRDSEEVIELFGASLSRD